MNIKLSSPAKDFRNITFIVAFSAQIDTGIVWALHGGSFSNDDSSARASSRIAFDPTCPAHNIGFRWVVDLPFSR